MSVDSDAAFTNTDNVAFPNNAAVNASGPSATDGTEFVKLMIDNYMFGPMQAMLDRAGLTPDGVTESASASQLIDALQLGIAMPAGTITEENWNTDPATLGIRALQLQGQGVLRANYPDLDARNYVGDSENSNAAAAGGAWYRADDAAGTTPNIAGIYLILPEGRGPGVRGLDTAASIDPDGASRYLGDLQEDAMQRITGSFVNGADGGLAAGAIVSGVFSLGAATADNPTNVSNGGNVAEFDNSTSTSPNAAKTDDVETRMYNRSTNFVVWY
jgi:hypothetical protein